MSKYKIQWNTHGFLEKDSSLTTLITPEKIFGIQHEGIFSIQAINIDDAKKQAISIFKKKYSKKHWVKKIQFIISGPESPTIDIKRTSIKLVEYL